MSTLVVTMAIDPEHVDQVRRHLADEVAPWATAQPGFVSGQWLVSHEAGRAIGLVRFDSPESAEKAAIGPRSYPADPGRPWSIEAVEVLEPVAEV